MPGLRPMSLTLADLDPDVREHLLRVRQQVGGAVYAMQLRQALADAERRNRLRAADATSRKYQPPARTPPPIVIHPRARRVGVSPARVFPAYVSSVTGAHHSESDLCLLPAAAVLDTAA